MGLFDSVKKTIGKLEQVADEGHKQFPPGLNMQLLHPLQQDLEKINEGREWPIMPLGLEWMKYKEEILLEMTHKPHTMTHGLGSNVFLNVSDNISLWKMHTESLAFMLHALDRLSFTTGGPKARDHMLDNFTEDSIIATVERAWVKPNNFNDPNFDHEKWVKGMHVELTDNVNIAGTEYGKCDAFFGTDDNWQSDDRYVLARFALNLSKAAGNNRPDQEQIRNITTFGFGFIYFGKLRYAIAEYWKSYELWAKQEIDKRKQTTSPLSATTTPVNTNTSEDTKSFCTKCGNTLNLDANFCGVCGSQVN